MKVLVLGGTGAIGQHLVKLLSRQNIQTVVTSRKERKSSNKVSYIHGNARDLDFLKTILIEPWDVIVDFMIYSTSEFERRVNDFLDATNQYIFLSSARIYADSESPIKETTPLLKDVSNDDLFLSKAGYPIKKAQQESILRMSGRSNWTIIRPYITYSENRLQLGVLEKEQWLYRAIRGRTIVFSKDIVSKKTTLTYGSDVSKAILKLINNSNALGEIYHITAPDSISWQKVLDIYLNVLNKHLGFRPRVLLQDLDQFTKIKSKFHVIYDRIYDRVFDNSKISAFIDPSQFLNPEEGLKNCLEEFINNTSYKSINWKFEAKADRSTGERTPLEEIIGFKQKMIYLFHRYKL